MKAEKDTLMQMILEALEEIKEEAKTNSEAI